MIILLFLFLLLRLFFFCIIATIQCSNKRESGKNMKEISVCLDPRPKQVSRFHELLIGVSRIAIGSEPSSVFNRHNGQPGILDGIWSQSQPNDKKDERPDNARNVNGGANKRVRRSRMNCAKRSRWRRVRLLFRRSFGLSHRSAIFLSACSFVCLAIHMMIRTTDVVRSQQ